MKKLLTGIVITSLILSFCTIGAMAAEYGRENSRYCADIPCNKINKTCNTICKITAISFDDAAGICGAVCDTAATDCEDADDTCDTVCDDRGSHHGSSGNSRCRNDPGRSSNSGGGRRHGRRGR